jgi:hypothetical protein
MPFIMPVSRRQAYGQAGPAAWLKVQGPSTQDIEAVNRVQKGERVSFVGGGDQSFGHSLLKAWYQE